MWTYVISSVLFYIAVSFFIRTFRKTEPNRNSVVLITGGAKGLGFEVAKLYAQKACTIIIWDILDELFESVKTEIQRIGGTCICMRVDVRNNEDVRSAAYQVISNHSKIDVLINNAGVLACDYLGNMREDKFNRTFDVNVKGAFQVTKAFYRYVRHVATVASVGSFITMDKFGEYSASKHALHGLMQAFRLESKIAKDRIKWTVVYPYHIKTDLFNMFRPKFPGNIIPSLTPQKVALELYYAICEGREEVFVPFYIRYIIYLCILLPSFIRDRLLILIYGGSMADDSSKFE